MYDSLKIRFEQTKQFVKKHPTVVACAVTAVVTAKVTRDKDVEALKAIAAEMMLNEADRSALLLDTTSFIDAKGLTKEFIAFAPRMRNV
jgi:hypothetical protein